jgi:hypothetical protein
MSDELENLDWKVREEIERRQDETFRRIHRLYKHGFRPNWRVIDVEDAIWWKYPGGHLDLILYPDGKLVASGGKVVLSPNEKEDKDRIYNDSTADAAAFDRWLASIKSIKRSQWFNF